MMNTANFIDRLEEAGIRKIAGVPCSFLTPLINEALNRRVYEPFVNEGDAVAYAAGACLAGEKVAVIMQNSGLTNALSPLTSLNELFGLHVLLIIGNRGKDDEPQHKIMAEAVKPFLDTLGIPYFSAEEEGAIEKAEECLKNHCAAILVNTKDTFSPVLLQKNDKNQELRKPTRYEILSTVADCAAREVIVTTTGFTSREMFCIKDRPQNFYMVGSMGCLSSLAAGIAEGTPDNQVIAVDGDSACLMRLGALYTLTEKQPHNLCYIVLDNEANESTGGQVNSLGKSRLFDVMNSMYPTKEICSAEEMTKAIKTFQKEKIYTQLYVRIKVGTMKDLPRPDRTLLYGQAKRFCKK